ncbi:MAG: nuclear transport factor 2 family protein [Thermoflexaceae bacterium]|nr:nuclear transport factor 2 family protein [Thermoflexaceae bacterium]
MPLTPEDMLAIHELYARYNHAVDSGDADAWAATFTADAEFRTNLDTSFKGTAELRAFATRLATRLDARHWNNNLIVEPAPGGAKAVCYLLLVRPGRPGVLAEAGATGIYRDELVKGIDGWRFKSRYATIEGEVPMKR